jgi:hypothetical protein
MTIVNRRITLLLSLLLFALPLFGGSEVSSVRYAPLAYFSAGDPAIASNGNRFLTLWYAETFVNTRFQTLGTLSDASGGSDSPAFPIVSGASYERAVIGTGSGYVAVWNDDNDRPAFARLDSAGVLERSVSLAGPSFSNPALAFNGSRIAVVDTNGGYEIDISIYDLNGNLLRRSPVTSYALETYAVIPVGNDFDVITGGYTGIIEWRVTNDGLGHAALRRILPPAANHTVYAVAAAAKNGSIVTAWTESPTGALASATIQPDGTITQSSLPTDGAAPGSAPVVLPVDRGYVIAWNVKPSASAKAGVFALRLDDNGASLDDRPSFLADGQFTSAASSGNTIKFAFPTSTASSAGVATVTATVDATGITTQPAAPVLAPVRQYSAAVTGNGAGFTVAWLEKESDAYRVVAGRTNPAGDPLDGTGIVLDFHASGAPVIAHGASEDLIVWTGNGRLKATRLSMSGAVLDGTPINLAPMLYDSAYDVVWNGSRFFVVWYDHYSGYFFSALVGPDGAVTPAKAFNVPFSSPYTYAQTVNVAWDGRQYIVVYQEFAPVSVGESPVVADIRVMRLSGAGLVLDPVPAQVSGVDGSGDGLVHVASSGSESLIVFDRQSGPVSVVLRDQDATLHLDPEVPLFHWQYGESSVAWNGSAYVVAMRYGLAPDFVHEPGWLAAIEVSQSGIPLRAAFTPAAAGVWYAPPSIANDLAAGTAVVSTEVTPQTYVPRARIYLQSEFSPMPAPPPAPRNAVSYFDGGTTARIDWQSDDGGNGFLIEKAYYGSWETYVGVPADARTATVFARIGDQFRIRAYGPGGFSEGTITTITTSVQRRRAARQ